MNIETQATSVAPYKLPESNNKKLLSLLKSISAIDQAPSEIIQGEVKHSIPSFKNIDVSDIVNSNSQKLITKRQESKYAFNNESDTPLDVYNGDEEETERYVEIDQLTPKSLKDQVNLVIIQNFPNIKKKSIENILSTLIKENEKGAHQDAFRWSHINYEFLDSKVIFVMFNTITLTKWFYEFYKEQISRFFGNDSVKLFVDPSSLTFFDQITEPPASIGDKEIDRCATKVGQILEKNSGKVKKSGTEDLDEVLNYYSKYKVDNEELIDVPNHMKDIITKEIIRFRSRVLIIERENRRKEIEQERIQTKERLKNLFRGIKEGENDGNDSVVKGKSEAGAETDDLDEIDGKDMTEQEHEEYLQQQEQEELDRQYKDKLEAVKKLEDSRDLLYSKLEALNNYENNLIDNKFEYIEEFKNFQENGLASLSQSNSLYSSIKLYYNNHSQYLKVRNPKRSAEELEDNEDEKEEANEVASEKQSSQDLANFSNKKAHVGDSDINIDTEKAPEGIKPDEKDTKTATSVNISSLSTNQTEKLRAKIIDLVEEYLGVKVDYLIDVIMENLKENNLGGKEDLIRDLTDVLDDDAESLVTDLWKFIDEL